MPCESVLARMPSLLNLALALVAAVVLPQAPRVQGLGIAPVGLAAAATPGPAHDPPAGRFIIPLHRQRVPVQSDADTVSYKSVYFGTISVGAPDKQKFSVVFDTGSGHVIIPSEACVSETCTIHNRYSREASLHAVDVDWDGSPVSPGAPRDQITVAFGTGEVTGQFVNDRLCLGWADEGRLVMEQEANPFSEHTNASAGGLHSSWEDNDGDRNKHNCVEVRIVTATDMTHEPFHAFAFDGVLGLGLDGLALAPEFSFFGMMTSQRQLQQPSFGVFLADSDDESSEISFGGHSPELVRSSLSWAPVAFPELGYWQVSITRLRIGNRTLDFCEDGQCRAVVDTGTSLLAVPKDFADTIQEELSSPLRDPEPNPNDGDVNCRKAEGALLQFDVGDFTLTLGPGDYARQSILLQDDAWATEEAGAEEAGNADGEEAAASTTEATGEAHEQDRVLDWEGAPRTCKPTLMPIDLPEPLGPKLFIWGEPVLRKYYTEYNWQEKKIGFGLAKHTWQEEEEEKAAAAAAAFAAAAPATTDKSSGAPAAKPKTLLRPLLRQ